ncbi:hypothetical protein HDU84_008548 [Entophlyctis sp. JEL0112]|nr:hypothetical protein HDU84_008548 [Entophlyctis sp. JEL0112]
MVRPAEARTDATSPSCVGVSDGMIVCLSDFLAIKVNREKIKGVLHYASRQASGESFAWGTGDYAEVAVGRVNWDDNGNTAGVNKIHKTEINPKTSSFKRRTSVKPKYYGDCSMADNNDAKQFIVIADLRGDCGMDENND